MDVLTIETQAATENRKGRSFSAVKLAQVTANSLWASGSFDRSIVRPIFLQVAATEAPLRAFLANLRGGHLAIDADGSKWRGNKVQILKSAGYRYDIQRNCGEQGSSVATIWLPELFDLDPGMVDPNGVRFVVLPPVWWLTEATEEYREAARQASLYNPLTVEQLLPWVPVAIAFGAMLDRRTRRPIPPQPAFLLRLFLAFLRNGLASMAYQDKQNDPWRWARKGSEYSRFYDEDGTEEVGLASGVAVSATHEQIDAILTQEVTNFFRGQ